MSFGLVSVTFSCILALLPRTFAVFKIVKNGVSAAISIFEEGRKSKKGVAHASSHGAVCGPDRDSPENPVTGTRVTSCSHAASRSPVTFTRANRKTDIATAESRPGRRVRNVSEMTHGLKHLG